MSKINIYNYVRQDRKNVLSNYKKILDIDEVVNDLRSELLKADYDSESGQKEKKRKV